MQTTPWIGACKHGRHLVACSSTKIFGQKSAKTPAVWATKSLLLGRRCWSFLLFLAPLKIPGDRTVCLCSCCTYCREDQLVPGHSWALWTRLALSLKALWCGVCVTPSKSRWVLTHTHTKKRSGLTGAVSEVWRWVPEGAEEGGRGYLSCKMELSHKFLTEPPPSFTDVLSQQDSGQQGSPCELSKVSLAGCGVLLAGRERTFLVSLTLADKITTVLTSWSCNKVLSSHRGNVRSDLWWAGFLLLGCFVWKVRKIFLSFSLRCC